MKSKELTKIFEKAKAEYLMDIRNNDSSYTCKGCDCDFMIIEIHHIIKRSKLKYYYADKRNFIELCSDCHIKAEGTISEQEKLNCYREMLKINYMLLREYYNLKPYEQLLSYKYG